MRAFLNALAVGVLLFLLWDVLTQAWEPVDAALAAADPGRATGFSIVAPLTADADRPGWIFLLGLGLIGGGPTLLGTLVGQHFTSDPVSLLFLALAAGSIPYVVVQLVGVGLRSSRWPLYTGMLAGLSAGFVTDMIVTAGGV